MKQQTSVLENLFAVFSVYQRHVTQLIDTLALRSTVAAESSSSNSSLQSQELVPVRNLYEYSTDFRMS